ncbi:MAG: hypothetical protein KJ077_05385 [Anaerolineae bacterium]|nr:hypothetical protein [Anaerolineae bacterium]
MTTVVGFIKNSSDATKVVQTLKKQEFDSLRLNMIDAKGSRKQSGYQVAR